MFVNTLPEELPVVVPEISTEFTTYVSALIKGRYYPVVCHHYG